MHVFVISFNSYLFIYFSVKYAIQSNDCDVFLNRQSILFYSKSLSHLCERGRVLHRMRTFHGILGGHRKKDRMSRSLLKGITSGELGVFYVRK